MKRILVLSFALTAIISSKLSAQGTTSLPQPAIVPHYHVQASFSSTTVLIFPSVVKPPADRGTRDVLAQKQPGVDNILKLKAARKNFTLTNLHVFTSDGKIYAFDVSYTDSLAQTYDFTNLTLPASTLASSPVALISEEPLNDGQLKQLVTSIKASHGKRQGPASHTAGMSIRLEKVALGGPLLFFRYRLTNHSNLAYPLDFLRMYIRDRVKSKRTSVQDKEILPFYEDSTTVIPGDASLTHVVAVPSFTLSHGKELIVEAYEKNGGRSLLLHVHNKTLLRTKKI